jgi:hypothetical protein
MISSAILIQSSDSIISWILSFSIGINSLIEHQPFVCITSPVNASINIAYSQNVPPFTFKESTYRDMKINPKF